LGSGLADGHQGDRNEKKRVTWIDLKIVFSQYWAVLPDLNAVFFYFVSIFGQYNGTWPSSRWDFWVFYPSWPLL
jgi:hypothetical protein